MEDYRLKLEDKIYWGRALGGCILGFLTEYLNLYRFGSIFAVFLAISIYIATVIILRVLLDSESITRLGRKLYLNGSGTFFALWILTWIFIHNLMVS
ncbi:MAG: hypothetical protein QW655_03765 [Nitrososphaerota archaeon]